MIVLRYVQLRCGEKVVSTSVVPHCLDPVRGNEANGFAGEVFDLPARDAYGLPIERLNVSLYDKVVLGSEGGARRRRKRSVSRRPLSRAAGRFCLLSNPSVSVLILFRVIVGFIRFIGECPCCRR